MLSWGSIGVSAALTALAAVLATASFERPLDARRLFLVAVAAGCGPLLWHALTRSSTPGPLTEELSQPAFPASRGDVGVGVCTLATSSVLLTLGADRRQSALRVGTIAIGCALAAFGIAVYLT